MANQTRQKKIIKGGGERKNNLHLDIFLKNISDSNPVITFINLAMHFKIANFNFMFMDISLNSFQNSEWNKKYYLLKSLNKIHMENKTSLDQILIKVQYFFFWSGHQFWTDNFCHSLQCMRSFTMFYLLYSKKLKSKWAVRQPCIIKIL